MKESVKNQIEKLRCLSPPTKEEFAVFLANVDFDIDKDFLEWTKQCSRAAGSISSEHYIQFWTISDMVALNPYYPDIVESRNLFFFATNGSSLGYAFDKTNGNVVSIDFLDIGDASPQKIGDSFLEFLHNLSIDQT